jgi:DNA-directed RNA polymerase specialized sigma24 family protein
LDTLSDNAIMLKVKNGDIDKMGLLYERYHNQLYRFIFNMTRQKELSEDMVQNIFLRMLKYPDGFMGYGEFKM